MRHIKSLSFLLFSLIITVFSLQFHNTAFARMDYSNPARYEKQSCYPLCGLQKYKQKIAKANAQKNEQNQNTNASYNANYNSQVNPTTTNNQNNPNDQMFTYYTKQNVNQNMNNQNRYYQDPQRLSQSGAMSYIVFLIVIVATYGIVFFIRKKRNDMLRLAA